jgi:thioredoxin 1
MMKKLYTVRIAILLFLGIASLFIFVGMISAEPSSPPEVPVKNMVTMVDFGAPFCVPCKAMAPFLEKLEKHYRGRAAIVILDVGKAPELCEQFDITEIPTQVFYDKQGKEVLRHTGFMNEKDIVNQLKTMGVK